MSNRFIMPKTIITGPDALKNSAAELCQKGKKALIVTGPVMVKIGNVKKLTDILDENNIEYAIYSDIYGEPVDSNVTEGLKIFREEKCDFIIGLGGGSPLDTMKAIAAMNSNPGEIADYYGKVITGKLVEMVAIPTTAGTGSEATKLTVITDTKRDIKMLLAGEPLMPGLAIIDPQFAMSAPPSITAATGLDALTHAIESFTSKKANLLTNGLALSAIKKLFKYLPIAYKDGSNVEAREKLSIAALEAGVCINNASVTLVHGMSRPIGAMFHVAHGVSNAMLMKVCFSFALDGAYEKFGELGRAIGVADAKTSDEEAAMAFLGEVENICKVCEIPTLAEYGIDKDKFFGLIDKMATDAIASGSPANTIKPVTKEDVIELYKQLWN